MSVKWRWDIPNIALFNQKKFTSAMQDETRRSLINITTVVQTNIQHGAPVGVTGLLKNSIGTEIKIDNRLKDSSGKVFSSVGYAQFVEEGRRAGRRPPLRAIMRWLAKAPKGRRRLAAINASGKLTARTLIGKVRQAAYMVQSAIAAKGTRKNPFFERGWRRSQSRIRLELGLFMRRLKQEMVK